ncbi:MULTISPECIES: WXG100 family type VII secretion target [unclassified Nocardioides]|jgi:WXG100 family type VII secretion target|uniref:WXG100 family type VII secretion target n=1 Tax=unclassified Nocardioides TaxID=2615069 RepID=UPI002666E285|nr:WXG100 family type VII secretion target [Nocardioides sp. Arc9.136]WKN48789.1 WXG100 family type VII secretion target [Nocardioides sp. Arc9.136]
MSQGMYGQGENTLSQAAGMVSDAHADFNNLANTLTGQIQGLQGKWVGQGGQAFFTLHQTWSEKQKVIVNALTDFENSLQSTEKDNKSTDEGNSGNLSNLTSRLS